MFVLVSTKRQREEQKHGIKREQRTQDSGEKISKEKWYESCEYLKSSVQTVLITNPSPHPLCTMMYIRSLFLSI